MADISILIVEDEFIIAEDIKNQFHKIGYRVAGMAKSYNKAIDLLNNELPDLVLIDIKLKGIKDGIDLAHTIKELYHLPIVFLTSFADKMTVNRVKKVSPEGYLVKPFERDDLYTAIEIALSNFVKRNSPDDETNAFDHGSHIIKDSIFVRKDHLLVKIKFEELKWIKAEGNYLELYCTDKKLLIRSTLKDFLNKLPSEIFLQTHRSYAVNKAFVSSFEYNIITIDTEEIPIGRSYVNSVRDNLIQ
jgi:two-component system, LytTR family, response regulator LytT